MLHWILTVLTIAWIIAMWWVVIHAIKRGWGPYLRSRRTPAARVQAKVKSKPARQEPNPYTGQSELTQKVLVFECEDGIERDYEVHDDVWDWVEIGDDGVLVYRGDLFVGFEARRPRHDLDKAFERLTRS